MPASTHEPLNAAAVATPTLSLDAERLTYKLGALPPAKRRLINLIMIFLETGSVALLQVAVNQLFDYFLNKARQAQNTRRQYPS